MEIGSDGKTVYVLRQNNVDSWGFNENVLHVGFNPPIPVERQILYISEDSDFEFELERQLEILIELRVVRHGKTARLTFD